MNRTTLLTAVLAVAFTACGGQPAPDATSETLGLLGAGAPLGMDGPPGFAGMHEKFAARLSLTDAQKGQLQQIGGKYKEKLGKADHEKAKEELKTLLSAEAVDAPALRAFIDARRQEFTDKRPARLALAGELRAVLTDAQRKELVTMMGEDHPGRAGFEGMREKMKERLYAELKPTELQKAALVRLETKLVGLASPASRTAMKTAVAGFVESGDQQALAIAVDGQLAGKLPVDELVEVATLLDKAQRALLLSRFEQLAKFRGHFGHGR